MGSLPFQLYIPRETLVYPARLAADSSDRVQAILTSRYTVYPNLDDIEGESVSRSISSDIQCNDSEVSIDYIPVSFPLAILDLQVWKEIK